MPSDARGKLVSGTWEELPRPGAASQTLLFSSSVGQRYLNQGPTSWCLFWVGRTYVGHMLEAFPTLQLLFCDYLSQNLGFNGLVRLAPAR